MASEDRHTRSWVVKLAATLVTLVILVYGISIGHSAIEKGWRDERARLIAQDLAASAVGTGVRVNIAQQYNTGCSLLLFEKYTKNCFAIYVTPESSDTGRSEVAPLARGRLCSMFEARVRSEYRGPVKASLQFFAVEEETLKDSTRKLTQTNVANCAVEKE